MHYLPTRSAGPGTATAIRGWQVQSSAVDREAGATISRPDYRAAGWLEAPPRSTVMAALLANGQYPDVFYSTNMRDQVDPALFQVPWWYRSTFTVVGSGRTLLRTEGIIHKADLWVNGTLIAGSDEIAGAYPVHTFDVTSVVVAGTNAVAIRVYPGHPMEDLSVGWVDWNPMPPDANMGVWRDVVVLRSGEVRLSDPHVLSEVALESLDHADLRVAVDVENAADGPRTVRVAGAVSGPGQSVRFGREVTLAAGERRRVVFTTAETSALGIADPALWWPVGHGGQPLYDVQLIASVDGLLSDQVNTAFGIRQVGSTLMPGGGRQFYVNGRPVQVLGGGWCPDIFLRYDHQRLVDELTYTVEMGLNAIRLEGKLENPEFYELANQFGVMVMPGWECCNKWEAHAGSGTASGAAPWSEQDFLIARRSMASEARLLRNHPSVLSFQIGSDFAPPPRLAELYVNELKAAEWTLPIVSSGSSEFNNDWDGGPSELGTTATAAAGPSGMKMWPYDWVPPVYWYAREYGGAIGFGSESSAGHSIPRLPSLRKMLAPQEIEQLWQDPDARQYHAAPPSPFENLAIFHAALAGRYGEVENLRDFLRKAQLANYEMVRAQFEAFGGRAGAEEPATGVIYWMLNTAWPSLNWHLFDYFLDPAGAYFGAKKANEPLHVQYAYDTNEILVVNHTPTGAGPFSVQLAVRDIAGGVRLSETRQVGQLAGSQAASGGKVELPDDISTTYFVELELRGASSAVVSRNVYWLSTQVDQLDWGNTFWQHTPQTQYADLKGLTGLAIATVGANATSRREAGHGTTMVTVTNTSPRATPLVGLHASIVAGNPASPIAPVLWDDNDITLFGGQSATLTARYSAAGLVGEPNVQIDAFNLRMPQIVAE
ncbi:MAG: exo,4-beta-D-glucosaminidase [Actinomycetota bacterium]|nr:exo,4-beta-D-glucosaminidase [Actinomycetota bacterium]